MSSIAVIGLGAMGSRIAGRLLSMGHEVFVWNRTPARLRPLVDMGAKARESPFAAAQGADALITMVSDPAALREVTEGPRGALAGLSAGSCLIEMSTVGPQAIARLTGALPQGVDLLDAPVLGSVSEAQEGRLSIFVGGAPALFERWSPLLAALGTPIPVGGQGMGAAAKLVANATLFGVLGVLGESLQLAQGLGLTRDGAFEVLARTPLAAQAARRRSSLERGEFPRRFRLSLARKDADLIAAAAQRLGLDLRLLEAARSWLLGAEAQGRGENDYSSVIEEILRSRSG